MQTTRHTRRFLGLLLLAFAVLAGLWSGCPRRDRLKFQRCTAAKGSPCMTDAWDKAKAAATPPPAWTATPHYWRYRKHNRTVGMMLLGHPKQRLVAALAPAIYLSLLKVASPDGFLTAGATYAMSPFGKHAVPELRKLLAEWDLLLDYVGKGGLLNVKTASVDDLATSLTQVRSQTQAFHQSSSTPKILVFHWNKKNGPLVLPYYTISDPPLPVTLRLPTRALSEKRAVLFGSLFFQQKLRRALPLYKLLWDKYYVHNMITQKRLFPEQLRCKYSWHQLFQLKDGTMKENRLHISIMQGQRQVFCEKKLIELFKKRGSTIRKLRLHRRTLTALNNAFRDYVSYHRIAGAHLAKRRILSLSAALDGLLRQHNLHYTEKVRFNGKVRSLSELFHEWQQQQFAPLWRQIHKQLQSEGKFMGGTKAQPAGYFSREDTVFSTRKLGFEYQINPSAIVGGNFAILLERSRGVINVLSPRSPYPFVGKRAYRKKGEAPKRGPKKRLSLRTMIERSVTRGLTLVHAGEANDIPSPHPQLPPRSFLFHEGHLWIRLKHTMTVIPLRGLKPKKLEKLSVATQKQIVKDAEEAMAQRDSVPFMITIQSVQGDKASLKFTFPGEKLDK